jgi:hypothetical protein
MDSPNDLLARARACLTLALQLLDEGNAPGDIGAHVDLAVTRVSEVLKERGDADQDVTQWSNISRGSANN